MFDFSESTISKWFAGKNVFVTGGTGFVGKIVVEKLLRGCPEINAVYMLIRSKKGQTPEQRFNEYASQLAFSVLKERKPEAFNKLKLVSGDITSTGLGLESQDRKELIENVHVVLHVAATVRFNPMFKEGVLLNVVGTHNVLELSTQMKQLVAHVHVSTTYCQHMNMVLEERLYPTDYDPLDIIEMTKVMSEELMEVLRPKMGIKHCNTYTYTKALAEVLVDKYKDVLPVCIARPSIVIVAKNEPLRGYTEYKHGPNGISLLGAHGIFHAMLCNDEYPTCYVPVDYVANATITIAWERGRNPNRSITPVYNIAESETCITWGDALAVGNSQLDVIPFSKMVWKPFGKNHNSYFVYKFLSLLFHYLPALLIDFALLLTGKKPAMYDLICKADRGLLSYAHFTMNRWSFKNDSLKALFKSMSDVDKELYDFDLWNMDWVQYIKYYSIGLRVYVAKDPLDTIPQAKKLMWRLTILHNVTKILLMMLAVWFAWNYLGFFVNALNFGIQKTGSMLLPLK